jgi:SLT domain-containing protein
MATINLLINAVNRASAPLQAIAASATDAANRIDDLNDRIDATSTALAGQAAAAGRAADQLDGLARSAAAAAAAQDGLAAKTAAGAAGARVAYGWWNLLAGRVALFGGAATIGALHLAVDVLAEIAAVVIPAGVALGAFGVAASDAVNNVIRHFTSLHTVADATGQSIWPLSGALEKLHDAVQPDVYQVLGDALLVANSRVGELQKLATGTGQVLDQLAARASVALESSGVSKFLDNAIPDVAKLGDVVGNIFGIVGNLLKSMPGYAEALLNILDGATKGLEAFTGSGFVQGALRAGLALHGLFVYGGLAATAVMALRTPLTALSVTALSGAARIGLVGTSAVSMAQGLGASAAQVARIRTSIGLAGDAAEEAGGKVSIMGRAMGLLSAVPVWGWVAIGAAALAGLVFWLTRSKSATQQWIAQLQTGINNQTTWTGLLQALGSAQQQVGTQIAQTTASLDKQAPHWVSAGRMVVQVNSAYTDQKQKLSDLTAAQQQFSSEQQTATSRMADLGKQAGGTQAALGLMAQAHVKVSDAATASAHAWALDVQQVLALQEGLRAMSNYAAGNAAATLEILDKQASDQYQAIAKVNSAWDTFTQNMADTQGSFDTVAQGYNTLSETGSSFKTTLGKLVVNLKYTQTAIDALTPSGIALNQAFTQQVANVSKLYDSWRTAGLQNDLFTAGVKASIAPLLKYASGSQEATAQLVGLAEQAGYQGPASLKTLTAWLGNTHGATQRLKDITNQATVQEALLSGAMHAQGNLIASQLLGDINQAILKYDGVTKAAQAYGQAVAQDGRDSAAAHAARQTLIDDLIKSGRAAGDSKNQIAAMITKVLGIPEKRALALVMTGEGSYFVNTASSAQQLAAENARQLAGGAAGMFVRRGTTSTADDVVVRVSRGELVVPANIVRTGAVDHLRGSIPGFAGGGLIEGGNTSVLSGQYAVTSYDKFTKTLTDAVASALKQALATGGGIPGNVASYANTVRTALGMLGQPLTDVSVVLRQMTTESGGNPTAVNLTDINAKRGTPSVGLMQVIGPTFAQWAGPFRNTGPFMYGVSTNPLANVYAGLDYAIHTYPNWTSVLGQGHGYAGGGIIPEPVAGIGLRSGSPYSFGENGPETVTPGTGPGRSGPLFTIQGDLVVRDEADAALIGQRLSGMVRMASLGGGWRR